MQVYLNSFNFLIKVHVGLIEIFLFDQLYYHIFVRFMLLEYIEIANVKSTIPVPITIYIYVICTYSFCLCNFQMTLLTGIEYSNFFLCVSICANWD